MQSAALRPRRCKVSWDQTSFHEGRSRPPRRCAAENRDRGEIERWHSRLARADVGGSASPTAVPGTVPTTQPSQSSILESPDRGPEVDQGRQRRPSTRLRIIPGYNTADREFRPGQDLFRPGEPCEAIYNLLEGWVILYSILEDGRRQVLHFALPGAVVGFHPGEGDTPAFGAQALTDALVCVLPHREFNPLAARHPEIGLRIASLLSKDRALAFDHLTSVGRRSARERVAHLILELFIRYRSQWPGSRIEEMRLPLTQEHIGDAIGLTFVHVNRVLRRLERDGILQFHYRRLRILDPDKLIDVAGIDPQLAMSWIGPQFAPSAIAQSPKE